MHYDGKPSWSVALNSGGEVTFALYVRDALSISSTAAESIPRLEPVVTGSLAQSVNPATLVQQWNQWWDRLVARKASSSAVAPAGFPDVLREWESELRRSFSQWTSSVRAAQGNGHKETRDVLPVQEAVTQLTRELGRDDLDFDLSIEEVPVEGPFWWHTAPGTVFASTTTLRSPQAVEQLRSVIRELVDR